LSEVVQQAVAEYCEWEGKKKKMMMMKKGRFWGHLAGRMDMSGMRFT
jgi:hypothetical protein